MPCFGTYSEMDFFIESGDFECGLYHLFFDNELGELFTRPAFRALWLGLLQVLGATVTVDTRFLPCLSILLMGWSFCSPPPPTCDGERFTLLWYSAGAVRP